MRRSPVGRRTRLGVAVALLLVATAACSVEDAMPAPFCQSEGSGLIVTQSVPSAELIPCFVAIPAGWDVATVAIDQDGTRATLDSDRAGTGAARLRFEDECDVGEAVEVPSDQDGADQFEFIEEIEPGFQAQRYYVFDGGCAWWDFDFDDDAPAALSIELAGQMMLLTRESVNQNVRQSFLDEEL
jgi:hypothetical protein